MMYRVLHVESKFSWPEFNSVNKSLIQKSFPRNLTSYLFSKGVFTLQAKPGKSDDGVIRLQAPRPSDTEQRTNRLSAKPWSHSLSRSRSPQRISGGYIRQRSPRHLTDTGRHQAQGSQPQYSQLHHQPPPYPLSERVLKGSWTKYSALFRLEPGLSSQ